MDASRRESVRMNDRRGSIECSGPTSQRNLARTGTEEKRKEERRAARNRSISDSGSPNIDSVGHSGREGRGAQHEEERGQEHDIANSDDADPTRQDSSSSVLRVSSFQGKVTLNPLGGHKLGGGDGFRSTRAVDATQPEDKRDTEEGKTMAETVAETLIRPMEEAPVPEEKQVATDDIHIQIETDDSCTSLHC